MWQVFEAGDLNSGRFGKELQVKQIPYDCSDLEPNSGTALIFPLKSLWNHLKEGNKRKANSWKNKLCDFLPPHSSFRVGLTISLITSGSIFSFFIFILVAVEIHTDYECFPQWATWIKIQIIIPQTCEHVIANLITKHMLNSNNLDCYWLKTRILWLSAVLLSKKFKEKKRNKAKV